MLSDIRDRVQKVSMEMISFHSVPPEEAWDLAVSKVAEELQMPVEDVIKATQLTGDEAICLSCGKQFPFVSAKGNCTGCEVDTMVGETTTSAAIPMGSSSAPAGGMAPPIGGWSSDGKVNGIKNHPGDLKKISKYAQFKVTPLLKKFPYSSKQVVDMLLKPHSIQGF